MQFVVICYFTKFDLDHEFKWSFWILLILNNDFRRLLGWRIGYRNNGPVDSFVFNYRKTKLTENVATMAETKISFRQKDPWGLIAFKSIFNSLSLSLGINNVCSIYVEMKLSNFFLFLIIFYIFFLFQDFSCIIQISTVVDHCKIRFYFRCKLYRLLQHATILLY